jgi:hypothetical protein
MLQGMSKKHFNLLEAYISTLNNMIQEMKKQGIHIHDNQDFDFAIEHIRYSEAQDKVLVSFHHVESEVDENE